MEKTELDKEVLAYVIHEIANPLSALLLKLRLIESEKASEYEKRNKISLLKSANFDVEVISKILDDARVHTKSSFIKKEDKGSFLFCELIEQLLFAAEKRAKTSFSVDLERAFVFADKIRIAQSISNLLDNAIKYSKSDVSIEVKGWISGDKYICQIKDTGPGIDPCCWETIFRKYHRASISSDGFGLGLFLSRKYLENDGGSLFVKESGPNGTTFELNLPLSKRTKDSGRVTPQLEKQEFDGDAAFQILNTSDLLLH